MIYLDHNATTTLSREVFDAMVPYMLDSFGNASSFYTIGRQAKQALEAKLANKNFVTKAKPQVVAQATDKLARLTEQLETVEKHLLELENSG